VTVELLPRPAPPGAKPLLIARGDLCLPLCGNWSAHLTMAEAQLSQMPTGKVTLRWLGQDLPGFIERKGDNASTVSLLVVGGDGGLGDVLEPKAYNATAATILRRLLQAVGEPTVAPDSSPDALAKMLDRWPQPASEAAEALDELARATGYLWRLQPTTGRVWLGLHAWNPAPTEGLIEETRDPVWELVQLALTQYGPEPGQVYEGRRIGHVVYTVTPERAAVKLWLLADDVSQELEADPLRAGLAQLIREVLRSDPRAAIPWAATYSARVETQRADGTIDVTPDNRALPPLPRVRVEVPIPGAKLTLQAGDRVRVAFDEMRPIRPVAQLYEQGSGSKAVARVGDRSQATALFGTWITQVQTAVNTAAPGSVTPIAAPTTTALVALLEGSPRISLS